MSRFRRRAGIALSSCSSVNSGISVIGFHLASGALNLYVAYNFEEQTWVRFRTYGFMGLSVVFVVANFIWIMRNAPPPEEGEDEAEEAPEVPRD